MTSQEKISALIAEYGEEWDDLEEHTKPKRFPKGFRTAKVGEQIPFGSLCYAEGAVKWAPWYGYHGESLQIWDRTYLPCAIPENHTSAPLHEDFGG